MLKRMVWMAAAGTMGVAAAEPPLTQPEGEPVLGGPRISEPSDARSTLVRWGYDGRLERLDTTPEQAAVELLDLSDEVRDRVNEVLAQRMAVFDRVVIESLDLAVRFESARALEDWDAVGRLVLAFAGRLGELVEGGTTRARLEAVLPPEQSERLARLVGEYHRALLTDERRVAQREGRRFRPIEAAVRARGEELGREIERAVRRSAAMGEAGFEIFLQALELAPEVESMIRGRTIDFARRHGFTPSKQAQDAFFAELFLELDRESRVRVMTGLLRYQNRGLDYGYGRDMPVDDGD